MDQYEADQQAINSIWSTAPNAVHTPYGFRVKCLNDAETIADMVRTLTETGKMSEAAAINVSREIFSRNAR